MAQMPLFLCLRLLWVVISVIALDVPTKDIKVAKNIFEDTHHFLTAANIGSSFALGHLAEPYSAGILPSRRERRGNFVQDSGCERSSLRVTASVAQPVTAKHPPGNRREREEVGKSWSMDWEMIDVAAELTLCLTKL